MARQIIPRATNGKLEYIPEGLEEFSETVAIDLLTKFPDVDFTDLVSVFERQFNYRVTRAFAIETAETR